MQSPSSAAQMGKKKEEPKHYPVAGTVTLAIEDQCCDVIGLDGNKEGTLLLKGWHSNYADFKASGVDCSILFTGNHVIIEADKRRYSIDLRTVIQKCLDIAAVDGRKVTNG